MEQLDFLRTKRLLNKYKLDIIGSLVKNQKQLLDFSKKREYPLVMKVIAKNIIHKSDLGLVKTNIRSEEELIDSFGELNKKSKKHSKKIDGVLIQQMVKGTEVIIGIKKDESSCVKTF